MRRITALLLFMCFFAIQYGRIMSYWECRLRAPTAAAKCECERIMAQADDKKMHYASSFTIKGVSEEVYDTAPCSLPGLPAIIPTKTIVSLHASPLADARTKGIFQPPRC